MPAVHPVAWAVLAAVLALTGSFAWAWSILEGIEITDPASPMRRARGMRLAATLIIMISTLAASSLAWRMAIASPMTASVPGPAPITSHLTTPMRGHAFEKA